MSSTPHIDVYAKELWELGFGYPLWNPDSPPNEDGVLIGDVGFVNKGTFYRMFNALKPADDPINHSGVPDGYEPFTFYSPEKSYFRKFGAINGGALHSKSIEQLAVTSSASRSVGPSCTLSHL